MWSRLSYKKYARKRFLKGRDTAQNRSNQQMIIGEVEILRRISNHSRARHLIKLRGSYTDEKCIGFLMEPVAELNLAEYLSTVSSNSPTFEENRTFLRSSYGCLASAVRFLHQESVRHRDLKPQNILVHSGQVFIADFGAALDWYKKGNSTTRDQSIHVTEFYRAPECSQGKPRNSKTDMWSLGVVFLEMTTVLRGRKLEAFFSHFTQFQKKEPSPHANIEALTSCTSTLSDCAAYRKGWACFHAEQCDARFQLTRHDVYSLLAYSYHMLLSLKTIANFAVSNSYTLAMPSIRQLRQSLNPMLSNVAQPCRPVI